MSAHFLNADLEVFSAYPLDLLVDEIGERALLLHGGPCNDDLPFMACYEIDHDPEQKSPDALILAFCRLVDSFSDACRVVWDSALHRVIDLGYEVVTGHGRIEDSISPEALRQMAVHGIRLAWTFYPAAEEPPADQSEAE